MNERERFLRLFRGESVDRPPLLDEGLREEVLENWQKQGMPPGKTHLEIFGLTPHENVGADIRFRQKYFGRIMGLSAKDYRNAFDVAADRFPEDWSDTVERLRDRDHVACVWASRGFFQALGVGNWATLREALLAVMKHPVKVRHRLEMYGEFCSWMLETTLRSVDPDFIYISEPISDNNGPLIPPDMFQEFMIPVFERLISVAGEHGVENILVSTYGNTAKLLPSMIRAGVNILWVSEAGDIPDMEYRTLRRIHGPGLGLIGGIPLDILRSETSEDMKRRLSRIIVPLMQSGRYIPLAGGRVRQEVPWPLYKQYREILAGLIS